MPHEGVPHGTHDVLAELPPFSWRELPAPPYDEVGFRFSHTQAERRWPYINGAGHDWTGREPLQFRVKMYFLNTLREGMFPDLWSEWQDALLDGRAGDLEHPVMGPMRAVVNEADVEVMAARRSGVIVNVTFTETIEDPELERTFGVLVANVQELAATADANLAQVGIAYPTGQRTSSLTELIGQIFSLAFSARLSAKGMLNQALGIVENLIDQVRALEDHLAWATYANMVDLWNGLKRLEQKASGTMDVNAGRVIRELTFDRDVTLEEVAAESENTLGEVMTLNVKLAGKPLVPAGTPVRVFAD